MSGVSRAGGRGLHADDDEMFVAVDPVRRQDVRRGVPYLAGQTHCQGGLGPPLVAGPRGRHGGRLGDSPVLASPVPVGLDGPGEGAVGGNVLIYFLGCYTHQ